MNTSKLQKSVHPIEHCSMTITLAQAHHEIFKHLDNVNLENPKYCVRSLSTRFGLWLDTLQFALDEAKNCLQLLQQHHNETGVDLTPLCTTVSHKFFGRLKECGLDNADCFMFLQKFDKLGEILGSNPNGHNFPILPGPDT